MKVRDSGMPKEDMWIEFFNVDLILSELQIIEIGFGYAHLHYLQQN